jgi:hypothetical protein
MTPTPPPSLIPAPPNFAVPEFVFPNLIPGKPRLPASFQLWPEVNPQAFPVTPPIPPTVQTGDVITASHENTVSTAISDLWIDLQSLAGSAITDPTSAKGDLIVRGISALGALAVGANGTLLTADTAAASGIRWGTPSFVPITRQVIAGAGMTGGGPLSADVTLNAKVTSVNGQIGAVVLTSADISGAVPSTRQIIAGTGLTGGGPLSADVTLNVAPDTTVQRIRYSYNGTLKGTRPEVNLIPGSNVTLSVADNPGTNRIDVTVAAAGGGSGGMVDPTQNLGDLIVRGTSTTVNLPVGAADGQVLTVDHLAGVGIKWAAPTAVGVPTSRKINTTLPALAGGGDLTADLTLVVMPDSIVQQTRVSYNGALVGTRREMNYIAGTGVTLTIADDTANNRVNVTIASAAVGGGPQTPWTSDINAAGFTLYSTGKVGIGIATPQAPLHVVSASTTVAMIETTAASVGQAVLNLKTPTSFWQVVTNGAGAPISGCLFVYDQTSAATRMVISPSGNVGVGVGMNVPSSLLQVGAGVPLAAGIADFYGPNRTLAAGTSLLNILSTDAMAVDKGGTLGLGGVGGAANPYAFAILAGRSENNSYAGYFQISTITSAGAFTERMRITSTGNIGIGTTSPNFLLSLGSAATARKLAVYDSGSDFFGFGVAAGILRYDSGLSSDHVFYTTSGTERMRIMGSNGRVGIGWAAPTALLAVLGTAADPVAATQNEFVSIVAGTGIALTMGIASSQTTSWIQSKWLNSDGRVFLLSLQPNGGNVGIGKLTAAYALDVTGDCNISGTYRVNGTAIGTGGVGVQVNNGTVNQSTTINFFSGAGINLSGAFGAGTFTLTIAAPSDLQLKRNVQSLAGGLPIIGRLRPITAEWNGLASTREGERMISVIAQDLQQVIPEAVKPYRAKLRLEDTDDTELLSVDSLAITAHLILAIQQLERRLKALEQKGN